MMPRREELKPLRLQELLREAIMLPKRPALPLKGIPLKRVPLPRETVATAQLSLPGVILQTAEPEAALRQGAAAAPEAALLLPAEVVQEVVPEVVLLQGAVAQEAAEAVVLLQAAKVVLPKAAAIAPEGIKHRP